MLAMPAPFGLHDGGGEGGEESVQRDCDRPGLRSSAVHVSPSTLAALRAARRESAVGQAGLARLRPVARALPGALTPWQLAVEAAAAPQRDGGGWSDERGPNVRAPSWGRLLR